jgi:hypothetical protein
MTLVSSFAFPWFTAFLAKNAGIRVIHVMDTRKKRQKCGRWRRIEYQ